MRTPSLAAALVLAAGGLLLTAALFLSACSGPPAEVPRGEGRLEPRGAAGGRLTIFAAASLTEAFREIGAAFEREHPGSAVLFNFAGAQQLALQLEEGAEADLFASADRRYMERVIAAGLVEAGAAAPFARNELVVIVPWDNPGRVESPRDLARPGLRLVLAGEQVPVGAYTRQALEKLAADPACGPGFRAAVEANVVSYEENVKQVVAKVQLGEADAGVAYRSDVTPALAGRVRRIDIPPQFNVVAVYPIAVLRSAPRGDLAREFVHLVLGPQGQRILEERGFAPLSR